MICKNCKTEIPDNLSTCPKCGSNTGVNQQLFCTKCGAALSEDKDFCTSCGSYTEKKKTEMEVAEIRLHGIQQENHLLAPVIQPVFITPVLDGPVQDLAHEHGHGILEHVITYTH